MAKHPIEPRTVGCQHVIEERLKYSIDPAARPVLLARKKQRTHHGRERKRDKRGRHHSEGHCHGKFMEQAADDTRHKEQRNENRDQ